LWLAVDAWRSAEHEFSLAEPVEPDHRKGLAAGLLLSLMNPQHLAYWAAIGSALGSLGVTRPTFAHYAVFFAGFLASSVAWAFVMSALLDRLFRRLGARWAPLTYRACAIALLALAIAMARELWVARSAPAQTIPGAVGQRWTEEPDDCPCHDENGNAAGETGRVVYREVRSRDRAHRSRGAVDPPQALSVGA